MVKSYWWWGGWPIDYCVSPSQNYWIFGFFRLGLNFQDLGPVGTDDWELKLGLDNKDDHP